MKIKIYTFCIAAFLLAAGNMNSNAATVTVHVQNFEFIPADFSITSGDTIMWVWNTNGGNHTTTSTTIPVGAVPWDELINANVTSYMYVPSVTGSYNYDCTFHASMGMTGHFTVTGSAGISDASPAMKLHLAATSPAIGELHIQYGISNTTKLSITLYDIIGNKVQTVFSALQSPGTYASTFEVQQLRSGIYMLRLETAEDVVSQRVIIE